MRTSSFFGCAFVAAVGLAGCSSAFSPSAGRVSLAASTASCAGVAVPPATDRQVQKLLDRNAAGTTFCFAPGTYRLAQPLDPKAGQHLIAAGTGVILNGAKVVARFVRAGSNYRATAYLQGGAASSTNCLIPESACDTAQDVFFDGKPLVRVVRLAQLANGSFYEDFRKNLIWLRDDPSGHLIEQAYAPAIVASNHGGIEVRGFIVEMAACPAQHGALQAQGYHGNGWSITGNEIRYNHGAGITSAPPDEQQGGSVIDGNFIHHNGQEGIGAVGNGLIVNDNVISFNNRVNYDCGWECGGAKFAGAYGNETEGLMVTGNDVHDNNGPGFWTDINSYNLVFEHNHIVNNRQTNPKTGYVTGSGIFLEISDRALVEDNVLENNGPVANAGTPALFYQGGQILLSATPNVTVRGNTVSGAIGIGMLQQERNDSCRFGKANSKNYPDGTPVCPYAYRNTFIHSVHDDAILDNRIAETAHSGNGDVAGLDSDLNGDAGVFSPEQHIAYTANAYTLADPSGRYFDWKNVTTAKSAWLAAGQDTKSTFK